MKKFIILTAMFLLGVYSMSASRQAIYLSCHNNKVSGEKEHSNRAPMHLPIHVVYDSDTKVIEVKGSESLGAEIYIYDEAGIVEDYSAYLNATFYILKPGTHVILIKGDGWEAEGMIEL